MNECMKQVRGIEINWIKHWNRISVQTLFTSIRIYNPFACDIKSLFVFNQQESQHFNPALTLTALIYFCRHHGDRRFFQFEIIINVLVSSFGFIWIPILRVYCHFTLSARGPTLDVRFWRLKTVLALKGLNEYYNFKSLILHWKSISISNFWFHIKNSNIYHSLEGVDTQLQWATCAIFILRII